MALITNSDIQEIVPSVFISNFFGARKKSNLYSSGITHVIVCAQELDQCFPEEFVYLQLPLADNPSQSISEYFDATNVFIKSSLNENGKVLVHCAGGGSRSASIVLAFLISGAADGRKFTLDGALEHLRGIRPIVDPNWGFLEQLRAYEIAQHKELLTSA